MVVRLPRFILLLLFAVVIIATNEPDVNLSNSPTKTENQELVKTEEIIQTSDDGKHVPVQVDQQCCGCGDCPDACSSLTIITDFGKIAKIGEDVKHVPVAMTRECCGCDNTVSYTGDCSASSIYTDGLLEVPSVTRRVTGKVGCQTVTGDPQTSFVTVGTTTIYTTRVSTLRRITRITSFSTTTVTSTVRLTKTDLSISARTVTTNQIFTQPTFVLLTRYFYVDSTTTTTTTAPTFVATITEVDTIVVNSQIRTDTQTTTTESTFETLTTFFVTDLDTLTFTFTDPTNIVITEAPSTNSITVTLGIVYTETSVLTVTTFVATTAVVIQSSVSTSLVLPIVYQDPTTVELYDGNARVSFAPTATYTFLIE